MSAALYTDLAWLPRTPDDFAARCKSLAASEGDCSAAVRALANHALGENQLKRLASVISGLQARGASLVKLKPFRLGIVSNATTDFIVPALVATAARHGISLHCIVANFDQAVQEAMTPGSAMSRAEPDAVLVALDYRGIPLGGDPGDADAAAATVERALAHLAMIRAGIRANTKAPCIVQTLARPPETLFGSFDSVLPGSQRSLIDSVNRGIASSIAGSADLLFDVVAVAETVGLANWHDPALWNMGKIPFSNSLLPLYADHLCRIIGAVRGLSRRCLILDLDNTVWSGVIGDDGLEGIVIGQGDPTGEAHLALQQVALGLRDRGIVLAVSSKNHDEVARRPFRQHPDMALREEHFAVFQANWNDKATNIEAIADALSLGLDAMVFVDDNPAERALVRRVLPQVAVPDLPDDPALYARTLLASGYFEPIAFSAEDRQRADFYSNNARRLELQQQAGDLTAYLESLQMEMTIRPFEETGRSRIAQLISKSNQFNLTTRRYTEAEVRELENDPDAFTLQVRLTDSFGDNGMISAVICRRTGRDWTVDTWLMSCRVLGRRVENAILRELVQFARARGLRKIIGVYRPTDRNKLVEDHYAKLGFALVERQDDGTTVWEWDVANEPGAIIPMTIRRVDFAAVSEQLV